MSMMMCHPSPAAKPTARDSVSDPLIDAFLRVRLGNADARYAARCLYYDGTTDGAPVELERAALPAPVRGVRRVVVCSDTHEKHAQLGALPAADVLVHCGDVAMTGRKYSSGGSARKLAGFGSWLAAHPCA